MKIRMEADFHPRKGLQRKYRRPARKPRGLRAEEFLAEPKTPGAVCGAASRRLPSPWGSRNWSGKPGFLRLRKKCARNRGLNIFMGTPGQGGDIPSRMDV
jgi:hypothetical protein